MPNEIGTARKFRYWIEYVLARGAFWLFRTLGQKRASDFGAWLGKVIGPRLSAHKTAESNLAMAFPDFSKEERNDVLEKMWDNLGRNAAELPFVSSIDHTAEDFDLVGIEFLNEFMESGRPALFITAHYGPWETTAVAGKYCNVDVNVVYRAANNPMVEEYFQKQRVGTGYKFVPKGKSGARSILKALKSNTPVALLNDQKQNNGMAVPFFGKDAMTATAVADFACRMKLPVYPVKAERLEDGGTRVTIYEAMFAPEDGDAQQNVFNFLKSINELYEDWIRERPDHWFWVHNRW